MGEFFEMVPDVTVCILQEGMWVPATIIEFCGDRVRTRYVNPKTGQAQEVWADQNSIFPFNGKKNGE